MTTGHASNQQQDERCSSYSLEDPLITSRSVPYAKPHPSDTLLEIAALECLPVRHVVVYRVDEHMD